MFIVKTWCESTKEGKDYLRYNHYTNIHRILNSNYFTCKSIGNKLADVIIVTKRTNT